MVVQNISASGNLIGSKIITDTSSIDEICQTIKEHI